MAKDKVRYSNKHYYYDVNRYKELEKKIKRANPQLHDIEVKFVVECRWSTPQWAFTNYGLYYWTYGENSVFATQGIISYNSIQEFFVNAISDNKDFVNFRINFLDEGNNVKYLNFACLQSYKMITVDRLTTIMNYQKELREGAR